MFEEGLPSVQLPYSTHATQARMRIHLKCSQSFSPFAKSTCLSSLTSVSTQKIPTSFSRVKLQNCLLYKCSLVFSSPLCWTRLTLLAELMTYISPQVLIQWFHFSILKSTTLGVFIPRKLANAPNKCLFSPWRASFYTFTKTPLHIIQMVTSQRVKNTQW